MWGCLTTAQLILESPGSTWPILSLFHPVDWSLIMKRSTRLSSCSCEIIEKPVLHNTTFQCPPWNKKHLNFFCPRETRRSLLQKENIKIRIKIFREEERAFIQTLYPGRIGIWRCCFCCGGRKTGAPGGKPSEQGENQPQTHRRVKLVGGEGHHCAISAPQELPPILNIEFGRPQGWSQNTLQGLCSLMSRVVSILHAKDIYFPVFHSVLPYDTDER